MPRCCAFPAAQAAVLVPAAAVSAVVALVLAAASPATAADRFTYTMRREVHAVDARSGAEVPFARQKVGTGERNTLGVTGRVAVARGAVMVEEGGQVFVHAEVPEALASRPHDLDVLVEGPDGTRPRGRIHFEPGGSRRVARLFVVPELAAGPAHFEVHVRDVHVDDWQEIVTEEVQVPEKARLRFGYTLEGTSGKSSAVELVVEARPEGDGAKPVQLLSTRASGADGRWEEEVEELGKLGGRRVRFVFRSRPASSDPGSSPGVVWGAPAVEVDEKRRAYPIIVLVSLDSLRRSSVGLYSSSGGATPFLDSYFGRKGAVMTRAVTQSVTTLPAHLTMLTGLNPLSHGVVDETRSLAPGVATLAEALREKGWHTAAFTEGGALAGELGFGRGFDLYDEGDSAEIDPLQADALARARQWLDEYSGAPLFLFVHTYATRPVHGGVDATADPTARDGQLAAYREQVRAADRAVEKLFATMKGRIDDEEALYVVTTGHGDEFFEHGAVGHGTQLYDESMHVPLLMRAERIRETGDHYLGVGLVDLAPTILQLAGVRVPSGMQGRSFARALESGGAVSTAPRYSEARRPVRLGADGRLLLWGPPSYAVQDGARKVIWNAGSDDSIEAYDLEADPRESKNLVVRGQAPDWARRLTSSLRSYPGTAGRQARPGGKAALSPANRSRLESLGYAR